MSAQPSDPPIRVVLCDDVAELRRLMRSVLEEDAGVEVVDEAGTGRECVRIAAERKPDVVVLDLSMPDMDGLEALPLIAKSSPASRIIVFSGFAAERMSGPALELGADLYIEKGTPLEELTAAVVRVARASGVPRAHTGGGGGPGAGDRPNRRSAWRLARALGSAGPGKRDFGSQRGAASGLARHGQLPVERRDPICETR
jgi:CheY-like chemotaxis protein